MADAATAVVEDDVEVSNMEAPEAEPTQMSEELLVEEVSIDGMCGVY